MAAQSLMQCRVDGMGKKVRRKGSKTVWEVWAEDKDTISVMNYSSYRSMSRIIKRKTFEKDWEYVRDWPEWGHDVAKRNRKIF